MSIVLNTGGILLVATILVLTSLCFSYNYSGGQLYQNYKVYEVINDRNNITKILENFASKSGSIIFPYDFEIVDNANQVIVAPHKVADFEMTLEMNDIRYNLISSNLQEILDETGKNITIEDKVITKRSLFSYDWKSYKKLESTYTWMRNLVKKYPNNVDLIKYGESYEGRELYVVKISRKDNTIRPGIFIEGGIHAREWISVTTATFIIMNLLTNQSPEIKNLAKNYDWYIVPHVNPDGYVYSQKIDRLWRKTRTPYRGGCFGADPNRNFDYHWKQIGASDDPCSNNYAGPKPFSEKETLALSNYIQSLNGKIQVYIALHSFSQYIMYPYGYSHNFPPNSLHLHEVVSAAAEALEKVHGMKYKAGNVFRLMQGTAGTSMDWVYGKQCIKMAFTFELRPIFEGQSLKAGMQLPSSQIKPTGEEILQSLVAMVEKIKELGYFNRNPN